MAASAQSDQKQPLRDSVDPNAEDYYSLLGVPFSATHAEITRAYRRAMKRAHPDRHHVEHRAQAEGLARQLNAAYAVLSDPIKRQAYDRSIRQQVIQDQIMQRYVGGFQAMDGAARPPTAEPRRQPTEAERRERMEADRKAWMLLLLVAIGITALIILAVVLASLFVSLWTAVR